jgi:hypothetical protein
MRSYASLSLLTGLTLSLFACKQPSPPTGSEPSAQNRAAPAAQNAPPAAAPVAPAAAPPAPTSDRKLPPGKFGGVPGWLGFTVQPADKRQFGWTPAHPNASVVLLKTEDWSETVEEGTAVRLVAKEGNLPLTFSEASQIPYGCDKKPVTMAAFRTPHDLAEQVVWILPESHQAAAALPVSAGAASKTQRTFTAGPLQVTVRLEGKDKGRLEVRREGAVLLSRPFARPKMEGADNAALDLTKDLEIGVPYPMAAFRIDPQLTLIVLRALSHEGVHFEVLALRDKLESVGEEYVYLCAF